MKKFFKNTAFLAAFLLTFSGAVLADCGNQCGDGGEVFGGGFVTGGGEGWSWGENDGNGEIVARGSIAESMSGFNGSFAFNADSCGDCEPNKVTVSGEGFTTNRGGSFIETTGGSAIAGSQAGGITLGEGGAFSNRFSTFQQ